ncbi:MAG: NERD domain-containing protein [Chitinispirillales bacterium]|jgi:hypothetical protein|nr:NERD domain-containing protein [Chitinispirillales bacterium]
MEKETEMLLQDLIKRQAEARDQIKENAKGFAELREQQKKIAEESEKRSKKIDEKLDRLNEIVNRVNNNIGYHAEQYFQTVFEKKLSFGKETYYYMLPNLKYSRKGKSAEFDIVLVNGESVAIIEAKNRIHPDFIKEIALNKVSQFREYFPIYENYKLYLGAAGFSFDESVVKEAKVYGIGIIRQVGDAVEIDDRDLKVY